MICNVDLQYKTKSNTQSFISGLIKNLSERFPNVKAEFINEEEIIKKFGEKYANKKGFVHKGTVVINRDLATIDTPLHEFGHVYLKVLEQTNPERYLEILETVDQFKDELEDLRSVYPELMDADLREEFFVTKLGLNTDKLLETVGYGNNSTRLSDLVSRFKSWIRRFTASIGFRNAIFKDADNLHDMLKQATEEMLDPSFKQYVDLELLNEVKFSKTVKIANEKDLLKSLILTDNKDIDKTTSKDSSNFIKNILKYIKNNYNAVKIEERIDANGKVTYVKDQILKDAKGDPLKGWQVAELEQFVDKFFKDDYNNLFTELVPLNELHKKEGFQHIGEEFKSYPHILVKILNVIQGSNHQRELSFYDISDKSLTGVYNADLKRKNIAGVFISDYDAEKIGITYTSNKVDVAKLQLGTLALRLKSKLSDNIKIEKLFIHNKQNPDQPVGTYIDEVVHNLKALNKITGINSLLDGSFQEVLNKSQNAENIRTNIENHYLFIIQGRLKNPTYFNRYDKNEKEKTTRLYKAIVDLHKEKTKPDKLQELIDTLSERLQSLGNQKTEQEEKRILNRYIAELLNVKDLYRQDERFVVKKIQSLTDSIAKTGNPILDKIFHFLTLAASRVRKYMVEFRSKDDKILTELISEFNSTNIVGKLDDLTLNNSRKFFEPLFEVVEAYDPVSKTKLKVKTGRLISPSSSEYNDLTPKQKEYIQHFNKESKASLYKLYKPEFISSDNLAPIIRKDSRDKLRDVLTSDNKLEKLKETWSTFWEEGLDNYAYHFERKDKNSSAYDLFENQFKKEEGNPYGNEYRLNLLGLKFEKGELIIEDISKNQSFETDMSFVLNSFVANNIRKAEFDKTSPLVDSLKSFLITNKENFGNTEDHSLEMLQDFVTRFVNENASDSKDLAAFNKTINMLQNNANVLILGFNFASGLKNLTTGWLTNVKESIINSFVKEGFTINSVTKAHAYITADTAKEANKTSILNKLNLMYGFYNMDYGSLVSKQNLATSKSLFKSKNFYYLNQAGDVLNRRLFAAASFIEEGSMDAYSLDEKGNLIYDERKDKRFYNADGSQTTLQKATLKRVKEEMIQEDGLDSSGKLKYGHTLRMRNSMKSRMDRVHGAYDNDFASNMQNYALFRAFTSLRKYMVDKTRQYFGLRGKDSSNIFSENEGMYVPVYDKNGEVIDVQWQAESQEAIFMSAYNLFYKELKNHNFNFVKAWKAAKPKTRKNMLYLLNDLIVASLLIAAFDNWVGEDDEDEKATLTGFIQYNLFKGTIDGASTGLGLGVDSTGSVTIGEQYIRLATQPFAVADFWGDAAKSFSDILTGKANSKDVDQVLSIMPLYTGRAYKLYNEIDKIENFVEEE